LVKQKKSEDKLRNNPSHHQNVVNMNRKNLKMIIKIILYLSKQGQAFRGHSESETSKNRGNFLELVKLFSEDDVDYITI
jgi:hypothetical protein